MKVKYKKISKIMNKFMRSRLKRMKKLQGKKMYRYKNYSKAYRV